MAKQLANDWKPKSCANPDARVSVTQVVDAHVHEAGPLPYGAPRPVEVGARLLGMIAGNDIGTDARKACEHRHGSGIEYDGLPTCLAVRQQEQASLKVDPFPPKIENFSKSRTGQNQKPQRCRGVRFD